MKLACGIPRLWSIELSILLFVAQHLLCSLQKEFCSPGDVWDQTNAHPGLSSRISCLPAAAKQQKVNDTNLSITCLFASRSLLFFWFSLTCARSCFLPSGWGISGLYWWRDLTGFSCPHPTPSATHSEPKEMMQLKLGSSSMDRQPHPARQWHSWAEPLTTVWAWCWTSEHEREDDKLISAQEPYTAMPRFAN